MNYKEKLEEAKNLYASANVDQKYVLESLFPELTEPGDENVKQKIINLIKKSNEVGGWALHKWEADEMLAWLENQGQKPIMNVPSREVILSIWDLGNEWKELTNGCISTEHGTQLDYIRKHWNESEYYLREKQGKQNHADKHELKFHEGDWVVNKFGDSWHIDSFDNKNYQVSDGKGNYNYFPIAKQDEMHHWSIVDANPGDVLAFSYASRLYILVYKGLYEKKFETLMSVFCFYNVEEDTYYDETDNFHVMNTGEIITPATKEQRDLLFQKMQEAGYIFDFEKKELQKIHVIDEGKAEIDHCFTKMMNGEKVNPTCNEEDEEYNGDDYGIDSLYHARRILEKTLGEVDGYQSDDGILEHKCAITAVKKLYEQKPAEWTEEDEETLDSILNDIKQNVIPDEDDVQWLKLLKGRMRPCQKWSEEDESMYTRTLGILGKCYMGQLPTKVEDELKWLKSLNTQKNLKQICNTVDLSKNKNKTLDLLYNELLEKYKGK